MSVDLVEVSISAARPIQMARFWAHALRWNVGSSSQFGVELLPADVTTFSLVFRQTRDEKSGQNRIHFDLTTTSISDQQATVTELLAIGASHIDIGQEPSETHVVLADPAGNEFCIIDPANRFLESCPRLGAVNCDGTHALGCFWSEALGWPLVWDHDQETAIQAPNGSGPKITWSGPPLMPKLGVERIHFHVAPRSNESVRAAIDHLVALGATRNSGYRCLDTIEFADVDGNNFCLLDR
jgi:Glyoxalase-like domain